MSGQDCQREFLYIKHPLNTKICDEATPEPIRLTRPRVLDLEFESTVGNAPGFKIQLQTGRYQPFSTPTVLSRCVSYPIYK